MALARGHLAVGPHWRRCRRRRRRDGEQESRSDRRVGVKVDRRERRIHDASTRRKSHTADEQGITGERARADDDEGSRTGPARGGEETTSQAASALRASFMTLLDEERRRRRERVGAPRTATVENGATLGKKRLSEIDGASASHQAVDIAEVVDRRCTTATRVSRSPVRYVNVAKRAHDHDSAVDESERSGRGSGLARRPRLVKARVGDERSW